MDKSLANAHKGVYTFRVNGTIHHKIGTLTHNIDEEPKFAQIYFHDQAYQIKRRGKIFLNANLSPNIIRDIHWYPVFFKVSGIGYDTHIIPDTHT